MKKGYELVDAMVRFHGRKTIDVGKTWPVHGYFATKDPSPELLLIEQVDWKFCGLAGWDDLFPGVIIKATVRVPRVKRPAGKAIPSFGASFGATRKAKKR